jgi:pimeloyl-ACP methyl ester carboxylesterase
MIFETSKKNKLQYSTWGNLKSKDVILFFHGFPGSHIQARGLEKFVKKHDFGLIAVDRPGYGQSSFFKPGDFKTHLDNILELLSSLNIQKFSILGVSGGAPMSYLMASQVPERIQKLIIVGGLIPYDSKSRKLFSVYQSRVLRFRKWIPSSVIVPLTNSILKYYGPEKKLQRFMTFLNEADKKALNNSENQLLILQSMIEARRQQSNGIVWDSDLFSNNWFENCDLEALKKIEIQYYHGKQDYILSYTMAEHMNKIFPHSKLNLFQEEGHYSLALGRAEEILLAFR